MRKSNPAKYPVNRNVQAYFLGEVHSRRTFLIDIDVLRSSLKSGADSFFDETWLIGFLWYEVSKNSEFDDEGDEELEDVFVVKSAAVNGWGPFLYECAMSKAVSDGFAGLSPDRSTVSIAARNMWKKFNNRDDIVKSELSQFDNLYPREFHEDSFLNYSYSMLEPFDVDRMVSKINTVFKLNSEDLNITMSEFRCHMDEKGENMFEFFRPLP